MVTRTVMTKKQEEVLGLYLKNGTNVSQTCKKANISRKTFYEWINKSDTFKTAVSDAKEGMIDFTESMLFKNIKAGSNTAILFYLKTQAKHRGYVEWIQTVADDEVIVYG